MKFEWNGCCGDVFVFEWAGKKVLRKEGRHEDVAVFAFQVNC